MNGASDGVYGSTSGLKDNLFIELWHACAGSIYIPKLWDKVFYFPQGHLEQIAILTRDQQDGHYKETPLQIMPSKILCIVIGVQLKVEDNTDEVFALITLFPLGEPQELVLEDNQAIQNPSELYSFSKILTSMETSKHGAFSIPMQHAEKCFHPLDMTLQPPTQDLVAKDMHGIEWNFRHIFHSHPREHLLTSGWNMFVNSKKLLPGDSCIFVSEENGEIGIGIRRGMNQQSNISTTLSQLSTQTMPFQSLLTAAHAVTTNTMFLVKYHPCPFEFMVPLNTYIESTQKDYSIGTRVHMIFDAEGSARRYGTIVGNEDIDPIVWPGSEWRCIKVQWDSMLNPCTYPERVCPWWIEPLGSSNLKGYPNLPLQNKEHVQNPLGLNGFANDDMAGSSFKREYHKVDMDLQGYRYKTGNDEKSKIFIFAFFIFLCLFIFFIFIFRPRM
ncbi:auxin response factor 2 isoform X2 [Cicer arietinum]|uniref:Auxin response factor n=1 Tax=Cicer arietinum TaxID=3827 RepID=A0A3Q7YGV2_CICAR|nr:auxin response factor 2 isoform X2 [Cicer arietinum]